MADAMLKHLTGLHQSLPSQPVYCLHFTHAQYRIFCRWLSIGSAMADHLLQLGKEVAPVDNTDSSIWHEYAERWLYLSEKLQPVLEAAIRLGESDTRN